MTIFTPEFIAEQEKMAKKAYIAEASDADVGLYRSYAAVYYPKALAEIERLKAKLAKRNKSNWHPASERPMRSIRNPSMSVDVVCINQFGSVVIGAWVGEGRWRIAGIGPYFQPTRWCYMWDWQGKREEG